MRDYEIEYQRLGQGLQISRKSSTKNIENAKRRKACKERLQNGTFSATQYLTAISLTIGHMSKLFYDESIHSDDDTFRNTCSFVAKQLKKHLHSSLMVMQIYAAIVDKNFLLKICTVPYAVARFRDYCRFSNNNLTLHSHLIAIYITLSFIIIFYNYIYSFLQC